MLGHSLVAMPFIIRIVLTALRGIPSETEDAAATLGGTPWRVFWRITLAADDAGPDRGGDTGVPRVIR